MLEKRLVGCVFACVHVYSSKNSVRHLHFNAWFMDRIENTSLHHQYQSFLWSFRYFYFSNNISMLNSIQFLMNCQLILNKLWIYLSTIRLFGIVDESNLVSFVCNFLKYFRHSLNLMNNMWIFEYSFWNNEKYLIEKSMMIFYKHGTVPKY